MLYEVITDKETMVFWGYSLKDGSQIWGPTEPTNDYTYFRDTVMMAYGKIYFAGYGGILYCYDAKSGHLDWTYGNGGPGNSTFSGLETAWGVITSYSIHYTKLYELQKIKSICRFW